MNIFFIGYDLNKDNGGMQRYYHTLLDYLSKQGHKIYTYTIVSGPPVNSRIQRIDRIEFIDEYPALKYLRLAGILKLQNVDHVFCGHMFLSSVADKLCRILNLNYTLFTHGTECWAGLFKKYSKHQNRLKKIVVVSDFSKNQLIGQGVLKDRIIYIPGVIDPVQYAAKSFKKEKDKFLLLTVCRHDKNQAYKGCDTVIKVLPVITSQIPNAEYWIVGEGDDIARLERFVNDYGVEKSVKFLGFLPYEELVNTYAASDVFIMPSRLSLDPEKVEGEGLGIVFLEAGIMGKPLIGPNQGGSVDIIRDSYNGFNVDPTNHLEIAEKVIRLARDANLRKIMGENARQVVLEKYTIAHLPEYIRQLVDRNTF